MLKNLNELLNESRTNYQNNFDPDEVRIPESFKIAYRARLENEQSMAQFTPHTTIVTNSNNQRIYMPNQWFYLAAYITPYLREVENYRSLLMDCVMKEYPRKDARDPFLRSLKNTADEGKKRRFSELIASYLPADYRGQDRDKAVEWLTRFATDYQWWQGQKTIDRGDYLISAGLGLIGVVNASSEYIARLAEMFLEYPSLYTKLMDDSDTADAEEQDEKTDAPIALQAPETSRLSGGINEIVYGAPGTGKSRYLENRYADTETERIIFHPEYTSFDFVGTYKPTTLYMSAQREIHRPDYTLFEAGEPLIDYRFVPGPFISVLVKAWLHPDKMYTLIIEEINRANAASVFGEIFQLLDREPGGESEYGISPSHDLELYLRSVNGMDKFISNGLKIPSNMNIVATMNSADQGVQPMDSAFKRRWNFRYMKIDADNAVHRDALIDYAGQRIKWGTFVNALNRKLNSLGYDEDRLVGTYFIKPGEVGNDRATDKLLLYLWDDVLRYNRREFFNPDIYTFAALSERFRTDDVLSLIETGYLSPGSEGMEDEVISAETDEESE